MRRWLKPLLAKKKLLHALLILNLMTHTLNGIADTTWETIAPGLRYTTLFPTQAKSPQQIHAFQIDLARYKLNLVLAKKRQKNSLHASRVAKKNHALIAVNGGFFEPSLQPLGLRIKSGAVVHPVKNISWWGIFTVQDSTARILSKKAYQFKHNIDFAVQAGPRLIINGKIPRLKSGVAQRSALGITPSGKVILLSTENWMISLNELANILRRPLSDNGLNCKNALNLDGGTSSQIYAQVNHFILNVPSVRGVSDVITVKAKQ